MSRHENQPGKSFWESGADTLDMADYATIPLWLMERIESVGFVVGTWQLLTEEAKRLRLEEAKKVTNVELVTLADDLFNNYQNVLSRFGNQEPVLTRQEVGYLGNKRILDFLQGTDLLPDKEVVVNIVGDAVQAACGLLLEATRAHVPTSRKKVFKSDAANVLENAAMIVHPDNLFQEDEE